VQPEQEKITPALSYGKSSFHEQRFWLNDEASQNMYRIFVTADVFQDEIFPLKAEALSNMDSIVVTAEVSQFDRSS